MAEVVKNKFGTLVGWNKVTIHAMGRDFEGVTKFKYEDTVALENAYGANKFPVGKEEGNYECSASISLFKEELIGMQRSLKPGGRIQDIEFDVICEYELNDGTIYKDITRNARAKNNGIEVTQGDGKIVTDLELVPSHIDWNVI